VIPGVNGHRVLLENRKEDAYASRIGPGRGINKLRLITLFLSVMLSLAVSAACPPEFSGAGDGTYYDTSAGIYACSLPRGDDLIAAINDPQWAGSQHCGECLHVIGPKGAVTVRVVDRCPECLSGDLDLSETAFDLIADRADGRVDISWDRVACPVSGPVAFEFEGSNPFYLKVQVQNHRYGITSMSYLDGDGYVTMDRSPDNHFIGMGVPNITDVQVRITATTSETLEASLGNPNNNDVLINGPRQLSVCSSDIFSDKFEQ